MNSKFCIAILLQFSFCVFTKSVPIKEISGVVKTTDDQISTPNTESSLIKNLTTSNSSIVLKTDAGVQDITSGEACPSLTSANSLTGFQLFKRLVHPCRFDRLKRPEPTPGHPLDVYARVYIYFLNNLEASNLQFNTHATLQLRYNDPRLRFNQLVKRARPILGDSDLRKELWIPHLFFANEKDSSVLGTSDKDILTSIAPDGTIIIAKRITATLFCKMDFRKFPFDEQACATVLESWMYNISEVRLNWEKNSPISMGPNQHLTEYILNDVVTNESTVNADLSNYRHGDFTGKYSSLSFTIVLNRQVGFYIIDYFIPSIMIVSASWITFWLQADQTAPRAMLGCTTMLTFISLASSQDKSLPKVSYIKGTEIWFMGCMGFIFMSLVEFAFVNTIWRRRRHVSLKKVNASNILKETLPNSRKKSKALNVPDQEQKEQKEQKDLKEPKTMKIDEKDDGLRLKVDQNHGHRNSASKLHIIESLPSIAEANNNNNGIESVQGNEVKHVRSRTSSKTSSIGNPEYRRRRSILHTHLPHLPTLHLTTMTPQQISFWIDKRSRIFFPVSFFAFNVFFWIFINFW